MQPARLTSISVTTRRYIILQCLYQTIDFQNYLLAYLGSIGKAGGESLWAYEWQFSQQTIPGLKRPSIMPFASRSTAAMQTRQEDDGIHLFICNKTRLQEAVCKPQNWDVKKQADVAVLRPATAFIPMSSLSAILVSSHRRLDSQASSCHATDSCQVIAICEFAAHDAI